MQINKIGRVLLCCATIMMCITLMVLTIYSSYTDETELVSHLNAKNLEITLVRTNLSSLVYGNDGVMRENVNSTKVDFTKANNKNIFDLTKSTQIVPGTKYKATMCLENKGSVVIGYYVEILLDENKSDDVLCKQIQVTITADNGKKVSKKLSDLKLGSENDLISSVDIGGSSTFDVEISFIDDDNVNNNAMEKKVDFDMVVYAIQIPSN